MYFYFCQIEYENKAENDHIFYDDFCEKIVYDYAIKYGDELRNDRISIWPSELAPLWVRNSLTTCTTNPELDKLDKLDEWLLCFRRFEISALRDPIEYYRENSKYALSFLELALKRVETSLDELWEEYENEYHVAIDVATRSDEGAASEQALDAEEFMKYAEETKKSINENEALREKLKKGISKQKSLRKNEKHIPRAFWETLEFRGEKTKFIPNVLATQSSDSVEPPAGKTKKRQQSNRRRKFPAMKKIIEHIQASPADGPGRWMSTAEVARKLNRSKGTLRNDRILKKGQDVAPLEKLYSVTRDKYGRLYYIGENNDACYYDETINPDGDDFANFYKRVDRK